MNPLRRLLLFAGPNGSGKSSLTTPETLAAFAVPAGRYINADDIARTLAVELPGIAQEEREQLAFRRSRDLRTTYQKQGVSFAFETVFSHPSTLMDMRQCRNQGFEIVVIFVTTSNVEINVERVSRRFRSGGHNVPVDRIRSRYERTMSLLPRIIEEADRAFVHDNSAEELAIYAYERGIAVAPNVPLPSFLKRRLSDPLEGRRHEREEVARDLGNIPAPDEEKGEYAGSILWKGTHYAVQETLFGSIAHDLLLLDLSPLLGSKVTIRYKENAATLHE